MARVAVVTERARLKRGMRAHAINSAKSIARARPQEELNDTDIPPNLLDEQGHRGRSSEGSIDWSDDRSLGVSRFEEAPPMELPEDIRREIEKSPDRDTILEVVSRLQSDGVKITSDVLAAIMATIAMTEGTVE